MLEQHCRQLFTICGFSFSSSLMEIYNQENKKGTGKAKSLRARLFCENDTVYSYIFHACKMI